MSAPVIVWLRRDLRLADQAAFFAAAQDGPVIPVYVLDDETAQHRRMGGASRWWLHHSLVRLDADLRAQGSRLILRRGKCEQVLAALAEEVSAREVHALHHVEPWWRNAEKAVAQRIDVTLHHGNYLAPPGSMLTGGRTPFKIYTPFWRALTERLPPPEPLPVPKLTAPESWPESDRLEDWHLLPTKPDWAAGFRAEWTPGESGAQARLADFADHARLYSEERNLPSKEGTSRLSPHIISAKFRPRRCGTQPPMQAVRSGPSSARSAGGIMPPTLSISSPITVQRATKRSSSGLSGAAAPKPMPTSSPVPWAALATRSSTPGCASSGTPGGCTTGYG